MVSRTTTVRDWMPVVLLPPVLVLGALLTGPARSVAPLGVVAAIVGCLPLVLRRRVPFVIFAVPLTAGIVLILWQLKPGDVIVLPMVALFDLAQYGDRRRSLWIAVVTVPCVAVSVIPFSTGDGQLAAVAFNLMLCLLAIAAGDILRSRQEITERDAATREQETLRSVGEERLQIAREIHDVVAHAMTSINVQAGVAAHLLERNPAHAHDALRDIKRTSGNALNDLRATLNALRDPEQSAPVSSPAGLEDVETLTDGLRAAGVTVELDVPPVADLPAPVQSAGYRIVQEALTNVARHASATAARIQIERERDAVTIEVTDDGGGAHGSGPMTAGNGLRGMRERALALGGSLEAAPAGTGGWRVRARLPITRGLSEPQP